MFTVGTVILTFTCRIKFSIAFLTHCWVHWNVVVINYNYIRKKRYQIYTMKHKGEMLLNTAAWSTEEAIECPKLNTYQLKTRKKEKQEKQTKRKYETIYGIQLWQMNSKFCTWTIMMHLFCKSKYALRSCTELQ